MTMLARLAFRSNLRQTNLQGDLKEPACIQSLNVEPRINGKNQALKTLASFLSRQLQGEMEDIWHKHHLQLMKISSTLIGMGFSFQLFRAVLYIGSSKIWSKSLLDQSVIFLFTLFQHKLLLNSLIFLLHHLIVQYSALIHSRGHRGSLIELINQKEVVGDLFNQLRLALQRRSQGRPAQVSFGSLIFL